MSTPHRYPTDLTERQWQAIAPLLPMPKKIPGGVGRPPCARRTVVNGIIYVTKTACQWRMLPKDYGHWNTLFDYFNRWRAQGVWSEAMDRLRAQERRRQGRLPEPSAGCAGANA